MYKHIRLSKSANAVQLIPFLSTESGAPLTLSHVNITGVANTARLVEALRSSAFRAENGETLLVGESHMFVGLGSAKDYSLNRLRAAAAKVARALVRIGTKSVSLTASSAWTAAPSDVKCTAQAAGSAFAQGFALGAWRMDLFDGKATRRLPRLASLAIFADDAAMRAGIVHGLIVADGTNTARRIAATPPNVAHPSWIASESKRIGRAGKMQVKVIDYARAKALGMGGLVAVGQGSAIKPCIVALSWTPKKVAARARGEHVVIVGKTITYDTGGYSLKVNNGMKGMKYDKCGGAAVMGIMQSIAALRLPMRVTAVLAVAENMVSHDSYRPDDIITMHNGVTVEVTNTDAEGRLVLADALSWACDTLAPTRILDLATLTGGVGVGLGHFCAGYFCENPQLRGQVEAAATASGERVWQLPLWTDHRDFMRSQHADLINSNPLRSAHPIQGAAFLSFFVPETVPWAHIDIAAVAVSDAAHEVTGVGPTGWGVRLCVDLLEKMT
ncbi:MAG: leucyl aminopeptidase family protein [Phycisphaerales bacterium]|nr:leucyl aminopeptidase family protein [Phycisphaerales bacterium]